MVTQANIDKPVVEHLEFDGIVEKKHLPTKKCHM